MRVGAVCASLSIGVGLVQIVFRLYKSAQRISVCASSIHSVRPQKAHSFSDPILSLYDHFKVMNTRTYCLPKRHAFARLLSLSLRMYQIHELSSPKSAIKMGHQRLITTSLYTFNC